MDGAVILYGYFQLSEDGIGKMKKKLILIRDPYNFYLLRPYSIRDRHQYFVGLLRLPCRIDWSVSGKATKTLITQYKRENRLYKCFCASFRQLYTKCQKLRDRNLRGERLNLLPANFLQALDSEERNSPDSLCDYERKPICGMNILEPKIITPKFEVEKTNSGKF